MLVATMLSACGTVPPSPSASPTPSPSPTVAIASPTPSPTEATPYTLDCGPLAGAPDDCAAAVEVGLRLLSLAPEDVSAVRVEAPGPTCSPSGPICRQPTVIVKVFNGAATVASGEMPLVRTDTGWISLFQIR